jgi:hypothetical protein
MESLKPGGKPHRDAKPFLWKRTAGICYETLQAALARLGNSVAPAEAHWRQFKDFSCVDKRLQD